MLKLLLFLAISTIPILSLPLTLPQLANIPSILLHFTSTHDLQWNTTLLPSGAVAKSTFIDIKLLEAMQGTLYKRSGTRTYTAGRFSLISDESEGALDKIKRRIFGSIKKPVKGVGSTRRNVLVEGREWFKKVGTGVGNVVKGLTQKRGENKVTTGIKKVGRVVERDDPDDGEQRLKERELGRGQERHWHPSTLVARDDPDAGGHKIRRGDPDSGGESLSARRTIDDPDAGGQKMRREEVPAEYSDADWKPKRSKPYSNSEESKRWIPEGDNWDDWDNPDDTWKDKEKRVYYMQNPKGSNDRLGGKRGEDGREFAKDGQAVWVPGQKLNGREVGGDPDAGGERRSIVKGFVGDGQAPPVDGFRRDGGEIERLKRSIPEGSVLVVEVEGLVSVYGAEDS